MVIRPNSTQTVSKYGDGDYTTIGHYYNNLQLSYHAFNVSPIFIQKGVTTNIEGFLYEWGTGNTTLIVTSNDKGDLLQDSRFIINPLLSPSDQTNVLMFIKKSEIQPIDLFSVSFDLILQNGDSDNWLGIYIGIEELEALDGGLGPLDPRTLGVGYITKFNVDFKAQATLSSFNLTQYTVTGYQGDNITVTPSLPVGATDNFTVNNGGELGGNDGGVAYFRKLFLQGNIVFNKKILVKAYHQTFLGTGWNYPDLWTIINGGGNARVNSMGLCGCSPTSYKQNTDSKYSMLMNENEYVTTIGAGSIGSTGTNGTERAGYLYENLTLQTIIEKHRYSGFSKVPKYAMNILRWKSRPTNEYLGIPQTEVDAIPDKDRMQWNTSGEGNTSGAFSSKGYNNDNNVNLTIDYKNSDCRVKYRYNTFNDGCTLTSFDVATGKGEMLIDSLLIPDLTTIMTTWTCGYNFTGASYVSYIIYNGNSIRFVFGGRYPNGANGNKNIQDSRTCMIMQQTNSNGEVLP